VSGRTYRLTVQGELGDSLASTLDGITLERVNGVTTLTGYMRDQAELQGFLRRVSDLGLTLLEVKTIDAGRWRSPTGFRSGADDAGAEVIASTSRKRLRLPTRARAVDEEE
jgi:hypothetical protein